MNADFMALGDNPALFVGVEQRGDRRYVEARLDPIALEQLRITPDYPALIAAMEKCEFKSLLQEVRDEAAKASSGEQPELKL